MTEFMLSLDTSAGTSVALARDGVILFEASSTDPMRHAEVLGSLMQQVLFDAGVDPKQITTVVAGMGPGPFTGLRIGIAAAEAFSAGRNIPLIPMVSHDAVAWSHFHTSQDPLLVVTDARRKEKFWTRYEYDPVNIFRRIEGPDLAPAENLPPHHAQVREVTTISAADLAAAAFHMHSHNLPFIPAQAIYLRSPDVTLSRGPKRVVQK